ncbi:hypothetical protein P170DRAFT_219798 [Aspergillus steynii IBT 23096]|uniref:Uncharacterized protein n=1 Tax=Aspergillus steynii IBT 23096 TaxID=1392250 RepID=A0A2I2G1F9_9EURO|nr:uncharacterized protein P170DRAFT_219798 [Aspergillus steynii IBT 23096]PLB46712.1 hypothetical protein P170DRAFT_219798 [Aspergillus steynii IBT 23096]
MPGQVSAATRNSSLRILALTKTRLHYPQEEMIYPRDVPMCMVSPCPNPPVQQSGGRCSLQDCGYSGPFSSDPWEGQSIGPWLLLRMYPRSTTEYFEHTCIAPSTRGRLLHLSGSRETREKSTWVWPSNFDIYDLIFKPQKAMCDPDKLLETLRSDSSFQHFSSWSQVLHLPGPDCARWSWTKTRSITRPCSRCSG